jgi:hypothetical protein
LLCPVAIELMADVMMQQRNEVIKAGAEAFARDVKEFVLDFVDPGHFALETHVWILRQADRQVLLCEV